MTAIIEPKHASTKQANLFKVLIGIGLSALSGVLLLLAFPPYGLWPLAWIGFVPYLFAQYRLMPYKWNSLAVALANLFWLGLFLARLFGTELGFFFTYMGVWIAIFNLLTSKDRNFHEITRYRWLVLIGMVSFVGFEMVRATIIPLVATSAFIGYTQAKQAWMIQPVSIFSVYSLDLLILLVNYSLALGTIALFDHLRKNPEVKAVEWRLARRWLDIAGIAFVFWTVLSLSMYISKAETTTIRVAVVRPNLPLPAFQDEVNTSEVRFNLLSDLVHEASAQGAKVVFTPEMMFNFDPQEEYTQQLRDLAGETDMYIFITYTVAQEGDPWRNEAVLLTPDGDFREIYGKNHAFGEPYSAIRGVYPVYDTPLGNLATLICHDANYTDVARKLTQNGAQLIAAPVHEFGSFGEQYWTNALFRAVENRTAVIVAGTANIAGIIEPDGTIVALNSDPEGSRLVLVGEVSLGTGPTWYTTLGDILGWLSMAGFLGAIVFQMLVERRDKKKYNR